MAKPDILKRLRNKSDQITADNLIAFSSTNGIDVHDSGITKDSIKSIVSNNPSVLAHLNNPKIHVTLKEKDDPQNRSCSCCPYYNLPFVSLLRI